MNFEILWSEAKALARPAQLLVPGNGDIVGYWHGMANPKRCLVVKLGNRWLNVHTSVATEVASPAVSNTPLIAVAHEILPPIDAIFARGSEAVGAWLSECHWQRDWGYNDNFAGRKLVQEYERKWQQNFPLYTQDAHAVLGGWHFPWPDDDWHDLLKCELVLWTLAESEPWLEVWKTNGQYMVKNRIT